MAQSLCEILQQPGSSTALRCALQAKEARRCGLARKNNGLKICLLRRMVGDGGETPEVACLPMTTVFVVGFVASPSLPSTQACNVTLLR